MTDLPQQQLNISATPEGWIDLIMGQPFVVYNALKETIGNRKFKKLTRCDDVITQGPGYTPPSGWDALRENLVAKHGGKIVITNGAMQALSAAFYVARQKGATRVCLPTPYWLLIPPLIEHAGLDWVPLDVADCVRSDTLLVTTPNNPSGACLTSDQMTLINHEANKTAGITVIHDAAYYTPVYLPEDHESVVLGDMQVYSFAKLFGLSSLRIGYIVCHDEDIYQHIVKYVNETTMCVSLPSQRIALNFLEYFDKNPKKLIKFQARARKYLNDNRRYFIENIDPSVLIMDDTEQHGMFLWAKPGPNLKRDTCKVAMLDGQLFGKPGYVRFSIAVSLEKLKQAVENLNRCSS